MEPLKQCIWNRNLASAMNTCWSFQHISESFLMESSSSLENLGPGCSRRGFIGEKVGINRLLVVVSGSPWHLLLGMYFCSNSIRPHTQTAYCHDLTEIMWLCYTEQCVGVCVMMLLCSCILSSYYVELGNCICSSLQTIQTCLTAWSYSPNHKTEQLGMFVWFVQSCRYSKLWNPDDERNSHSKHVELYKDCRINT